MELVGTIIIGKKKLEERLFFNTPRYFYNIHSAVSLSNVTITIYNAVNSHISILTFIFKCKYMQE